MKLIACFKNQERFLSNFAGTSASISTSTSETEIPHRFKGFPFITLLASLLPMVHKIFANSHFPLYRFPTYPPRQNNDLGSFVRERKHRSKSGGMPAFPCFFTELAHFLLGGHECCNCESLLRSSTVTSVSRRGFELTLQHFSSKEPNPRRPRPPGTCSAASHKITNP